MRLLITTQAVDLDDPILGFFHRWLEEFAKHCDTVEVICLKQGRHDLPANVHVHSLGKEDGVSRVKYLLNFYRYIFSLHYDAVFVHMNPEYVVLAGWWWRLSGRRVVLWYVHRARNVRLRIAVFFANTVLSTARESITLASPKIRIVGHGIDVEKFSSQPLKPFDARALKIVSVGRITPIKHLETIIDALALLREQDVLARLDLIGEPSVGSDRDYKEKLTALIEKHGLQEQVSFLGPIKNPEMPAVYPRYDLSVNACPTGGIDKAVLESMASGVIVLVCNEGFRSYFDELSPELIFTFENPNDLATKIQSLISIPRSSTAPNTITSAREGKGECPDCGRAHNAVLCMKVCFFGIHDPGYARTRVLQLGFERLGHTVVHCRVDPRVEKWYKEIFRTLSRIPEDPHRALRPRDRMFPRTVGRVARTHTLRTTNHL